MTRDELKRLARERLEAVRGGIIVIRNERNGKVLLAASQNPQGLINRYRYQLAAGAHANRELQEDWQSQGEAAFSFAVLDLIPENATDPEGELEALAALWMEQERPYGERGYNTPPRQ